MPDVVCIGQSIVDVFVGGAQDEFDPGRRVKYCDSITLEIGGDATNESRVLKRLGVDVAIVHGRGDDGAGVLLKGLFDQDGVDLSQTIVFPGLSSGAAILLLPKDRNEERSVIACREGRSHLTFKVTPQMIQGAKIVSFASLFYEPFRDPEYVYSAAKLVKDSGAILCADCNVNPNANVNDYADSFKFIDYFFPNDGEAFHFSGTDSVEAAADFFFNMGVKNVILKTGKNGGYVKNAQGAFYFPAYYVPKVVDLTGAGDNFAAGFICGLLEGKPLKECLRFACATASIAIQTVGASTGVRSKQQVLDVISANEYKI